VSILGTERKRTVVVNTILFSNSLRLRELGGRDSNPDKQIQSLRSYRWTTSQKVYRIN
jgi:hypothetical protein